MIIRCFLSLIFDVDRQVRLFQAFNNPICIFDFLEYVSTFYIGIPISTSLLSRFDYCDKFTLLRLNLFRLMNRSCPFPRYCVFVSGTLICDKRIKQEYFGATSNAILRPSIHMSEMKGNWSLSFQILVRLGSR